MKKAIAAALALTAASSLSAQDYSAAVPISGNWTYAATPGGSDATFANAAGIPQLWMQCTRATRLLSIAKPASAPAPFVNVWTSSQARSVASAFNPATGRLTIQLGAYDPLLDAIAASRGRIAFTVGTQPPLVIPPWPEASRVIEDCRT